VPYRYGGSTPRGFDCSGLVYYAYRRLGIRVPRSTTAQYRHARPVTLNNLQPGDLVFFRRAHHSVTHVGIYAGNARFIHAPSNGRVVSYDSLYDPYWKKRLAGRGAMTEVCLRMTRIRALVGAGLPVNGSLDGRRLRGHARSCSRLSLDDSHLLEFHHATMPVVLLAVILSIMSSSLQAGEPPFTLAPCPASPNCVSSQAGDHDHFTEPLRFTGDAGAAWARLKSALDTESRLTIVEDTGSYLRAEARSLIFRFVDDVEFLLDTEAGVIQLRSASRAGYSDFGVNRRRVERIRKAFYEQR
jgi:uncharacterized protein (DUF1499 family)